MKVIFLIISLIGSFLILTPTMVSAQNSTSSNARNELNDTGGLSSESVDLAASNETTKVLNTSDSSNNTGGLSSESVTESKY